MYLGLGNWCLGLLIATYLEHSIRELLHATRSILIRHYIPTILHWAMLYDFRWFIIPSRLQMCLIAMYFLRYKLIVITIKHVSHGSTCEPSARCLQKERLHNINKTSPNLMFGSAVSRNIECFTRFDYL